MLIKDKKIKYFLTQVDATFKYSQNQVIRLFSRGDDRLLFLEDNEHIIEIFDKVVDDINIYMFYVVVIKDMSNIPLEKLDILHKLNN